jgi:hypothetical protein
LRFGRIEELRTAAEDDLRAIEILQRDSLLVVAVGHVRGEAGGGGVGYGCGGDEAEPALFRLQGGTDRLHLAAFVGHVDVAVRHALPAAPGGGGCGGVGDKGIGRGGIHQPLDGGRRLKEFPPAGGSLAGLLRQGLGQRQHAVAHAVGDHEDDAADALCRSRGSFGVRRRKQAAETSEEAGLENMAAGRFHGQGRGISGHSAAGQGAYGEEMVTVSDFFPDGPESPLTAEPVVLSLDGRRNPACL